MAKFGVVLPDELADKINAPLEYGDSRSARIKEMTRVGLAAEEVLKEYDLAANIQGKDRATYVEQALDHYIRTVELSEDKVEPDAE